MSVDWKCGDLALCVSIEHPRFQYPSSTLRVGRVYTVRRVGEPRFEIDGDCVLGLLGINPKRGPGFGFPSSLFRRIDPLSDHEEAEFRSDLANDRAADLVRQA